MGRAMTSNVSALSSFVANGHQLVHPVSSSLSEIPYGGFSPVRLQIGHPGATFATALSSGRLYAPRVRLARLCPLALPLCGGGRGIGEQPVQRPLARQRVVLSRRVVAYYGLIRGSGPLSPTYACSFRQRVFASRPRPGASLLYSACPSVRAVCRTPADRAGMAASRFARDSLRPSVRGSASAVIHAKVGSRVGVLSRLHSSLYAAARTVACPAPTQDVYFRAFIP